MSKFRLTKSKPTPTMAMFEEAIRFYFSHRRKHNNVLECLAYKHGIVISLRTLRRHLKSFSLCWRKNPSDSLNVAMFLTNEVSAGRTHGYKLHHLSCNQHGYCVSQETVRHILCIIDPVRVELCRRRRLRRCLYSNPGPNFLWHVDGYDKFKSYSLCVHGTIDGFSRHVIWNRESTPKTNASCSERRSW